MALIGYKSPIPRILNVRWLKATASGAIVPDTILAKSEVIVVQIFAPRV